MNSKIKADLSYRSFDELLNASSNDFKKENFNKRAICTTLLKIYDKGVSFIDIGDDEKAYIMLMRFFESIKFIRKSKLYAEDRAYVDNIIDMKKLEKTLVHLESIKESLIKRYKQLQDNEAKIDREKEEKKAAKDLQDKTATFNLSQQKFVKSTQLKELISKSNYRFLIVDIRSKADFDYSHINLSILLPDAKKQQNLVDYVNLPGEIIENVSWKIEEALKKSPTDANACRAFCERASYDFLIIFDRDSTTNYYMKRDSKLLMLKKAIFEFDPNVKLKNEPIVLDGGWLDWISYFPAFSTSAKTDIRPAESTQSTVQRNDLKKILDFDYPSLATEAAKPQPAPLAATIAGATTEARPKLAKPESSSGDSSFATDESKPKTNIVSIPVVNRSTKPAVQAINSVPQSITQDLNALNIREPTKPAFISSQPPSTPAFQPPKFQSPQLQPTDGDSSDIFTAVYMPNTRMNTFQSPLMQDGSKKVLDEYTGVYKYQEGFANETPDQAGKKEIRVRDQPVTPRPLITATNRKDLQLTGSLPPKRLNITAELDISVI